MNYELCKDCQHCRDFQKSFVLHNFVDYSVDKNKVITNGWFCDVVSPKLVGNKTTKFNFTANCFKCMNKDICKQCIESEPESLSWSDLDEKMWEAKKVRCPVASLYNYKEPWNFVTSWIPFRRMYHLEFCKYKLEQVVMK